MIWYAFAYALLSVFGAFLQCAQERPDVTPTKPYVKLIAFCLALLNLFCIWNVWSRSCVWFQ